MINSKAFVLLLLKECGGYFESSTKIQKIAFLSIYENEMPSFTDFTWYNYGPYSKELSETIDRMNLDGLINIKEETLISRFGDEYKIHKYYLTKKGYNKLQKNMNMINNDEKFSLYKTLRFYGKKPLSEVLNYVYEAYSPEDLE